MANHTLANGFYAFNADDNQNDGADNLFAHEYEYDVEYNMQNGMLLGVGESANGFNVLKSLKGFDKWPKSPINGLGQSLTTKQLGPSSKTT